MMNSPVPSRPTDQAQQIEALRQQVASLQEAVTATQEAIVKLTGAQDWKDWAKEILVGPAQQPNS